MAAFSGEWLDALGVRGFAGKPLIIAEALLSRPVRSGTRVQADRGRGRDVQRLLAAWLGNAHRKIGAARDFRAHALPFVAQRPGAGPGQLLPCAATRHGANWWRSPVRPALPVAPAQALPPAAGRSARPCRRAAPWDSTSAAVPVDREHLAKSECSRAAQDRAHVAGVLHPVEDHGGLAGCKAGALCKLAARSPCAQETPARSSRQQARRRSRRCWPPAPDHSVAGRRPEGLGKHRNFGLHAALDGCPAQVIALQPDTALLAIGGAVLREPAQVLEQRVGRRGDELGIGRRSRYA